MVDISFTVVIPTLNEEAVIQRCVTTVRTALPSAEIIVADGGSSDNTLRIAGECQVKLVNAPRGRGAQCNTGAASASGDIILFLHADTLLPPDAGKYLHTLFADPKVSIGTFRLGFDRRHWLLDLVSFYTSKHQGKIRFGDAGITVRKGFFSRIGGFPNQLLFEDLELLRRAAKITRIYRFPLEVTTSARRLISNGPFKQTLLNMWYTARYLLGTPADKLAEKYERQNHRLGRRSLLMMIRFPEPGKVKTRLAAGTSKTAAANIYRRCAERLFTAADRLHGPVELIAYIADAADVSRVAAWTEGKYKIKTQPPGGLGDRLKRGFAAEFNSGATAVVITASDVPNIDTGTLEAAFDALRNHDVVIGPSPDGGYYLIGLTKPMPQLFKDIEWSSGKVLKTTLRTVERLGRSVHVLPTLQDIDTAEDWQDWLGSGQTATSFVTDEYVTMR